MSRSGAWVYAAKLTVDGLADKIPAGGTELHSKHANPRGRRKEEGGRRKETLMEKPEDKPGWRCYDLWDLEHLDVYMRSTSLSATTTAKRTVRTERGRRRRCFYLFAPSREQCRSSMYLEHPQRQSYTSNR
ncbi:hypothetical protein KQX54_002408 [Cotesia glomerata]|uniref:Uncharacterized protein n=1 Tax=Cotesia glomerata TaxID=32391 RepID=A0AAV7I4J0_COTGL|nr:hypothetical protein KQX54_002408 [Cotesia glomerata]